MATLEQLRAQDAWQCSQGCSEEYVKLAKGMPALMMNSGLMQVMAFMHEKGGSDSQKQCRDLAQHLQTWLCHRFPDDIESAQFGTLMTALMGAEPRTYQHITTEAFAWLRWVRQMAAAAHAGRG